VELGEIEAALLRQPGVRESVVIASGEAGRHKRLLGYVVLEGESRREPGSEEVIRDPLERALFKLGRPGNRTLESAGVALSTLPESLGQSWQRLPWNGTAPTLESLGGWLCALAARPVEGAPLPKYYYPSSGSLNPIQAYLEVGEGAVAGLSGGAYYYDPAGHRLQALGAAVGVAGVRLHLVAEQSAVRPLYGRSGDELCDVEAGYVAELLRLTAPVHGVSLRVSESEAELAGRLSLGANHRPVLSLEVGSGTAQPADLSLGRVERQSYRRYARRALTQTQWQRLVGSLGAESGVRWYAYVRPQGVEGLSAGYYRIDAETGASTPLGADGSEPERRYGGGSAATYAQSAVALYAAGMPTRESRLASGAQSQRVMTAGVKAGVGVCPIGGFNPAGIAEQLELSAGEEVVHSLLAGAIDVEQTRAWEQEPAPQPVVERLRAALSACLPAYMVPSALMVLERIPLTSNGKVDRRALPQPKESAGPVRAYAAPRTELERSLAEIWSEVLGVERVGVDDHFFEIGGDSLKAVQVQTRVRARFNTDVQLREMYTHATLGALAAALSPRVGAVEAESAGRDPSAVKSASLRRRKARLVLDMTDEEVARMLAERRALKEHADGA
jgi:nitroreductase/acyl carrier protein